MEKKGLRSPEDNTQGVGRTVEWPWQVVKSHESVANDEEDRHWSLKATALVDMVVVEKRNIIDAGNLHGSEELKKV